MARGKSVGLAVKMEEPRRQPRQERARMTHDVILAGAAKVLRTVGWSGFNTNAVAVASGISVGSLYQYFANKDEIAIALFNQQYQLVKERVTAHIRANQARQAADNLAGTAGKQDSNTVAVAVQAFTKLFLADGGMYFVLHSEIKGAARQKIGEMFADFAAFVFQSFAHGSGRLRPDLSPNTAFVLIYAVGGVLAEAHRQNKTPEELAQLQEELAFMVTKYIRL